jgi:hypothetical protein
MLIVGPDCLGSLHREHRAKHGLCPALLTPRQGLALPGDITPAEATDTEVDIRLLLGHRAPIHNITPMKTAHSTQGKTHPSIVSLSKRTSCRSIQMSDRCTGLRLRMRRLGGVR